MAWAGRAGALYAAGADRHVVRLDPASGAVVGRFEAGRHPLSALAVTPDGGRAFAASAAVAAWEPQAQRRLFKFTGHPVRSPVAPAEARLWGNLPAAEYPRPVWPRLKETCGCSVWCSTLWSTQSVQQHPSPVI